jgi:hypothetical protein
LPLIGTPRRCRADNIDEVSALVVDFGSYTTRAGYAGEDCPRVVCPSFFGYTNEPDAAEGENGENGGDILMSEAETAPAATTNGAGPTSKQGKRKLYVGEDGVGVWRKGMEVDNMMLDGICKSVFICAMASVAVENAVTTQLLRTDCRQRRWVADVQCTIQKLPRLFCTTSCTNAYLWTPLNTP